MNRPDRLRNPDEWREAIGLCAYIRHTYGMRWNIGADYYKGRPVI